MAFPEGGCMSARDAILSRLRTAGANTRLPRPSAPPATLVSAAEPHHVLVDRFREELQLIGVVSWLEVSADAVQARVAELAGDASVLSWHPRELPYDAGRFLIDPATPDAPRDVQAAAGVGITGCDAAIAETGSLVMLSGPGRSRAVSLLPPFHIAIVRSDQLYGSMGEFFAQRRSDIVKAASCTFITGPSRSADIEFTLTLGVHGPGRVAVVMGP
jgi:L-lactate dehydrogenase complex protein LldG